MWKVPTERLSRYAIGVLVSLNCEAVAAKKATASQATTLGEWLWWPFLDPSMVFSTTESGPFRRDESAEVCVARRLGYDHPTRFAQVLLNKSEWQELLSENSTHVACFIGRFGLYGPQAPDQLALPKGRLEFPLQFRPKHLKPNEIDELYHCIVERLGSNAGDKHQTIDKDGIRTDYAVVQRYPHQRNGRQLIVVNLAGCTSLGTFAAASWAADKLLQTVDSTGNRLEVPLGIRQSSILEVLLKVTAADKGLRWRIQEIEVLRLFLDNSCWSPETLAWEEVKISEICLKIRPDGSFEFLFDGRPSRIKPNGKYGRVLAAMVRLMSQRSCNHVELAELANDASIWTRKTGGVQTVPIVEVRDVLKHLRSIHLHSALTVREDVAYVHAAVRLEDAGPPDTRVPKAK